MRPSKRHSLVQGHALVGSAASSGQLVPHVRSGSVPPVEDGAFGPSSRALRGERRPGAGRGEAGAGHHLRLRREESRCGHHRGD